MILTDEYNKVRESKFYQPIKQKSNEPRHNMKKG